MYAIRSYYEIAARMSSTTLALLNVAGTAIFRRMFAGIQVTGLGKVAEYARNHPIVLVPSHRSYFDFLILSLLFYDRHIIPPHIAARENMAFGPFGFLWRRAGAFVITSYSIHYTKLYDLPYRHPDLFLKILIFLARSL